MKDENMVWHWIELDARGCDPLAAQCKGAGRSFASPDIRGAMDGKYQPFCVFREFRGLPVHKTQKPVKFGKETVKFSPHQPNTHNEPQTIIVWHISNISRFTSPQNPKTGKVW